jgi:transposase-like protein
VWRKGTLNGRQRYKCRGCGRDSYGVPDPPPPPPCPHCGGRCVRGGKADYGARLLLCRDCGRKSVHPDDAAPAPAPRPTADGRAPVCHRCGGRDLVNNGVEHRGRGDRPRYRCRACKRATYGVARPPRPELPCPYCGAQCRRAGRNASGRRRYRCPACKRQNTKLWPQDRVSPGGPFPHRRSFGLDILAEKSLLEYCNRHGLSAAQAFRAILREAATTALYLGSVARVTARDEHGRPLDTEVRHLHAPATPDPLPRRLPDGRPAAARRFSSQSGYQYKRPTVYVTQHLTVMLDDLAYTGLLRTMRRRGLNHQDAARALVKEAAPWRRPTWMTQ